MSIPDVARGRNVRNSTIWIALVCLLLLAMVSLPMSTWAQEELPDVPEDPEAPQQVDVEPTAEDEEIAQRLARILQATEWFIDPRVEVRDGVVFLDGQTRRESRREWAGNLARNTQDVVAVVNRIEVLPRALFDFSPAWAEIRSLWRGAIQALPVSIFGAVVLVLSWWLATLIARLASSILRPRLDSGLLTRITSRVLAIPVFLLGLYLVLQVAGLTGLALTVLGGTGIVGVVIGFAFRDIAENFLASVLLSTQRPFRRQDVIEVAGHTGVVQQMNTRSTILMTADGNHIQIPNATVFKNTIVNYTANPNRRADFVVGIGYENRISQAQELLVQVINDHPAVLKTPEPLVLVDELAAATVNLRLYFWFDGTQYEPIKVKSSLMRLAKRALEGARISMPDEDREVIFPKGVPLVEGEQHERGDTAKVPKGPPGTPASPEPVSTAAEGELRSGEREIRQQAEHSRIPEDGNNLLEEE
jgi:small conductance mechanosensitive channel